MHDFAENSEDFLLDGESPEIHKNRWRGDSHLNSQSL